VRVAAHRYSFAALAIAARSIAPTTVEGERDAKRNARPASATKRPAKAASSMRREAAAIARGEIK
jgi:hypothetical protein